MGMDEKLRTICALQGVFVRSEAIELGYDDRTIAVLVKAGEWVRVRRGAFTFGDLWALADGRTRHGLQARAVLRSAKSPAALSHTSAVLEHTDSFWDLDLDEVHVTRTDLKAGRREAGVVQHRGKVEKGDIVDVNGVRATSPVRSALELTTVAGVEKSLVVVNDLLHRKVCTLHDMKTRYASMQHWPNTLHTDLVLRLADARMESVGETRTAHLMWRFGVPYPVPQFKIVDGQGQVVGFVDFAWPELGVFLEFDGKQKYTKFLREGEDPGDAVFREKKREDLIRRITGWRCIRITWADLENPEATAIRIMRELAFQKSA